MKIIIQSPHNKPSESLQRFIKEKVTKLEKYSDDIIAADVTLHQEEKANEEKQVCEIMLSVKGKDFFVKKKSRLFEDAILKSIDVLKEKLNKRKDKQVAKRKK